MRKQLNQINFTLILLIGISFGYCQPVLKIIDYRPFPDEINILNLKPSKISWSIANKFLLLDQNKGELFEISQFGEFKLSGTNSKKNSRYDELIWMGVSPMGVQIIDRFENELIQIDFRLNPIQSIHFNHAIFPELASIDPWGRLFIYSKTYNSIFLFENSSIDKIPFIDLGKEFKIESCIIDLENNENGFLGLLDCNGFFYIFSQNGQIQESIPLKIKEPEFLVPLRDDWLVLNKFGDCVSIKFNQMISLPGFNRPVIDVASFNRNIAILSNDHILIVNAKYN